MNKIAIGFLTKDRVELSKRTVKALLQPDKFDLWWFDGSNTDAGIVLPTKYRTHGDHTYHFTNVRGGPDAAVAYALTTMLGGGYDYVGLCENDVLLDPDWFDPTFALFERGRRAGLEVGAVSARAYEDRVLLQRDGWAVMHGLGWGQQLLSRHAAALTLKHFRTHWSTENRRTFARLSGIDIGPYWAFRTNEHMLCADWGNDAMLARHGLASLALTPSPVQMIGQVPSLEQQGLTIVKEPVKARMDDKAFDQYADTTRRIREGVLTFPDSIRFRADDGAETIMAHQLLGLDDAQFWGNWRHHWAQGFGPFACQSVEAGASFSANISGPCEVLVGGGEKGGQVAVEDLRSGYIVRPTLPPDTGGQIMQAAVPGQVSYRPVRLTCLTGGLNFYGIRSREPQPTVAWTFDHSQLPGM